MHLYESFVDILLPRGASREVMTRTDFVGVIRTMQGGVVVIRFHRREIGYSVGLAAAAQIVSEHGSAPVRARVLKFLDQQRRTRINVGDV